MSLDSLRIVVPFYLDTIGDQVEENGFNWEFGHFDYLPTDDSGLLFSVDSTYSVVPASIYNGIKGATISYSATYNTIIFFLFVLCLGIVSLIYNKEGAVLTNNFKSLLYSGRKNSTNFKEQVSDSEIWGEFLLLIQSVFVVGVVFFTYALDVGLIFETAIGKILSFVAILLSIVVFIGLKVGGYKIISLFFLSKDIDEWIGRYLNIVGLLGLVMLFPAVLLSYLPEHRESIYISILIIFFISRIVVSIELFKVFAKNKVGSLYFFSYLCGIEIAPYVLYYKLMLSMTFILRNTIL